MGGAQESVRDPAEIGTTSMLNAGNSALSFPSLTLIEIFAYTPRCCTNGMPVKAPDVVSNDAQDGMLVIVKVSGSPSGSLPVGVKLYCKSCIAVGGGVPDKLGVWFAGGGISLDEQENMASVTADNIK